MSETCQFEVDAVDGVELRATLRLCHPDEHFIWVSPAAIACLLAQAADNAGAAETARALSASGFFFEQEATDDQELAALDAEAARFIASLDVGPVQNANVVASRPNVVYRVERVPRASDDPLVALVVRVTDASLLSKLEEGYRLATIQSPMGPMP